MIIIILRERGLDMAFFDKISVVPTAIAGATGFVAGVGLAAYIGSLVTKYKVTEEQAKRNILNKTELNYEYLGKTHNVATDYAFILKNLYSEISQTVGDADLSAQFKKAIDKNALARTDEDDDSNIFIPCLTMNMQNFLDSKKTDSSGAEDAILGTFQSYKDAKGNKMDHYLAIVQILENIVIIYRELLREQIKIPGDEQTEKLINLKNAFLGFMKSFKTSGLYHHKGWDKRESKREKIFPKIEDAIIQMSDEAITKQKLLSIAQQSEEKKHSILTAFEGMAECFERISEKDIYSSLKYRRFSRQSGIIEDGVTTKMSPEDDLISNIMKVKWKNVINTFFLDQNNQKQNPGFSYFNYLINVTDENHPAPAEESGQVYLPRIAEDAGIIDADVVADAPAIRQYFKYLMMAAAMQADLTKRISDFGWVNLTMTGEFAFRNQLINSFLERAQQIEKELTAKKKPATEKEPNPKGNFFHTFMTFTSDADQMALEQEKDAELLTVGADRISPADKGTGKLALLVDGKVNDRFGLPLTNYAHAMAARKASQNFNDIAKIDKEWENIAEKAQQAAKKEGLTVVGAGGSKVDDEFLYNVALVCVDDQKLRDIFSANLRSDNTNSLALYNYVVLLSDIKKNMGEDASYEMSYAGHDKAPTAEITVTKEGQTTYPKKGISAEQMDKIQVASFFKDLSENEELKQVFKEIFEIEIKADTDSIRFTPKKIDLVDKESVSVFYDNLVKLESFFGRNYLEVKYGDSSKVGSSLSGLLNKISAITNQVEKFNEKIDISPEEILRIEINRQQSEYNSALRAMRDQHEAVTGELVKKLNTLQGTQKEIIENLLKNSDAIIGKLMGVIEQQNSKYIDLLKSSNNDIEAVVEQSFVEIKASLQDLNEKRDALYTTIDKTIEAAQENSAIANKAVESNKETLERTNTQFVELTSAAMEILTSISNKVEKGNTSLIATYDKKISEMDGKLVEKEKESEQLKEENAAINNTVDELNDSNTKLNENLDKLKGNLAEQEKRSKSIASELAELHSMAQNLVSDSKKSDTDTDTDTDADNKKFSFADTKQKLEERVNKLSESKTLSVHDLAEIKETNTELQRLFGYLKSAEDFSNVITAKIESIVKDHQLNAQLTKTNVDTVSDMKITLSEQRNQLNHLKEQIAVLQGKLEISMQNEIQTLKDTIQLMKEHKTELSQQSTELAVMKSEGVAQLQAQIEAQKILIEELRTKNTTMEAEVKAANNKSDQATAELEVKKQEHAAAMKASEAKVTEKEAVILDLIKQNMSNTLARFTEIDSSIKASCEASQNELKIQQRIYEQEQAKIDAEMKTVKTRIEGLNNLLVAAPQPAALAPLLPTTKKTSAEILKTLRDACVALIGEIETDAASHYTKSASDITKLGWINQLANELTRSGLTNSDFFTKFKALLIVCLENKDGNEWHRSSYTHMGGKIVDWLDQDEYTAIQGYLFGKGKYYYNATYYELAGKLRTDNDAIAAAKTIMARGDDDKLTIEQFGEKANTQALLSSFLKDEEKIILKRDQAQIELDRLTAQSKKDDLDELKIKLADDPNKFKEQMAKIAETITKIERKMKRDVPLSQANSDKLHEHLVELGKLEKDYQGILLEIRGNKINVDVVKINTRLTEIATRLDVINQSVSNILRVSAGSQFKLHAQPQSQPVTQSTTTGHKPPAPRGGGDKK